MVRAIRSEMAHAPSTGRRGAAIKNETADSHRALHLRAPFGLALGGVEPQGATRGIIVLSGVDRTSERETLLPRVLVPRLVAPAVACPGELASVLRLLLHDAANAVREFAIMRAVEHGVADRDLLCF